MWANFIENEKQAGKPVEKTTQNLEEEGEEDCK
jgi:hypothetical protein